MFQVVFEPQWMIKSMFVSVISWNLLIRKILSISRLLLHYMYSLPFLKFNSLLYCLLFLLLLFMLGSTECGCACRLNSLWCHIQPRPLLVWGWRRRGQCSGAARLTGVCGGGGWCWDSTRGPSSNHYNTVFCALPPRCGGFVQGKVFRLVCWISGRLGHHLVKGRVWVWTRLQLEEGGWKKELEEACTSSNG